MKYLVLWSGGLDSTYLIWKLLNEGHSVKACRLILGGNSFQADREKKAIDAIYPYFNVWDNFYYSETTKVTINADGDNLKLKYIPALVATAMYSLDKDIDYVAFGYVSNDDALSYLEDIKKVLIGFSGLCHNHVKVIFPLKKIKKVEIVRDLPKVYTDLVAYCENNENDKVCGKCPSCVRHKNALTWVENNKGAEL